MSNKEIFEKARAEFWKTRRAQGERQVSQGTRDQGARGTVTAGRHLDSFSAAIREIFIAEGLNPKFVQAKRRLSIPGFFRPSKDWDIVVCNERELGALIELKSQVGSLGNNFNNRAEEAIGNAKDVRVAHQNNLLGAESPFLGFLMVFDTSAAALKSRRTRVRFFEVDPVLKDTSYTVRYQELLRRLVREQLYDAACLLPTPEDGVVRADVDSEVALDQFLAKIVSRASYLSLRPGWS